MPQVVRPNGLFLGSGVFIFAGAGDPAERTGDDTVGAADGSIYLRQDPPDANHVLYVKAGGVWTAK